MNGGFCRWRNSKLWCRFKSRRGYSSFFFLSSFFYSLTFYCLFSQLTPLASQDFCENVFLVVGRICVWIVRLLVKSMKLGRSVQLHVPNKCGYGAIAKYYGLSRYFRCPKWSSIETGSENFKPEVVLKKHNFIL